MSVEYRESTYGGYYASKMGTSESLNNLQSETNAKYIYRYFLDKGWTINAIAALLGNMSHESALNPGRIQGNVVPKGDLLRFGGGIGLVQWTKPSPTKRNPDPVNAYINWLKSSLGRPQDYTLMDNNLDMIHECGASQWANRQAWNYFTFNEFIHSTLSVEYLTRAFMCCFERPANQSEIKQKARADSGVSWYHFLMSIPPDYTNVVVTSKPPINSDRSKYYINPGYPTESSVRGVSNCGLGKSSASTGSKHDPYLNTLPNCVGLAWGAFNETYVETMKANGSPVEEKFHYRVRGDAKYIISESAKVGYTTLPPSAKPPLGGLIVWGGTKNHVAYISEVVDDNTIKVQQSGYDSNINTWTWREDTYSRNAKGTNVWGYGGTCLGFLENPAIKPEGTLFYQPKPTIKGATQTSPKSISILGDTGGLNYVTTGCVCYVKWDSDNASPTNYDSYASFSGVGSFTLNVIKPRGAKSVSIMPIQTSLNGDVYGDVFNIGSPDITPSYPCVNIYTNGQFEEYKPMLYTDGQFTLSIPTLRYNNRWVKIYDTDTEIIR